MSSWLNRFIRPATWFASFLMLTLLLLPVGHLAASGPLQDGGESVDIYDKECTWWLDFDDDGEGDTEIDTGPDHYANQETPVVGSCEFKLNASVAATLLLETELDDWRSEVEVAREPGGRDRKVLQPGKVTIPELQGGMKITVEHKGLTPRSQKSRTLHEDYAHEIQVPRPFDLLEITITTPAGNYDRPEENANSASSAYIKTRERISDINAGGETALPDAVRALAGDLLDEGYPQIADRLLDVEVASGEDINWWMWSTVGLIGLVLLAAAGIAVFSLQNARRSSAPVPVPSSRERGNM